MSHNIGVVGLGAMGLGSAKSLRRAGHRVHACDVRMEAALAFAAEGGVSCECPAQVAQHREVDRQRGRQLPLQIEAVLSGEQGAAGGMKPGSVFIMCSTVDPNWAVALEARLARQDILMPDAPISGGAAKAGKQDDSAVIKIFPGIAVPRAS